MECHRDNCIRFARTTKASPLLQKSSFISLAPPRGGTRSKSRVAVAVPAVAPRGGPRENRDSGLPSRAVHSLVHQRLRFSVLLQKCSCFIGNNKLVCVCVCVCLCVCVSVCACTQQCDATRIGSETHRVATVGAHTKRISTIRRWRRAKPKQYRSGGKVGVRGTHQPRKNTRYMLVSAVRRAPPAWWQTAKSGLILEPVTLQTGTNERHPQVRYVPHTHREVSRPCSQAQTATPQSSRAQSSVLVGHSDAILANATCTREMLMVSTFHICPRFPIWLRKGLQTRAKVGSPNFASAKPPAVDWTP